MTPQNPTPNPTADAIRGEFYPHARLPGFAQELAATHAIQPGRPWGRPLLRRLKDNRRALLRSARFLAADARSGAGVSPTGEWLVDNLGLIEEQLREIEEDLPPGFYRELPKLSRGEHAGYPRVYALAWGYLEHTESRLELASLKRFLMAYQAVQPLDIGELWAVAISLRLVLVENLRRIGDALVQSRVDRVAADHLADGLLDPARQARAHRQLEGLKQHRLSPAFLVQLIQRLRDRDPLTTPALLWLEEQLKWQRQVAEELVREEHVRLAAMHGPVRDGVTSLRTLSSVDWAEFVEELSLLEAALVRPELKADFSTRDQCRRVVEALARRSKLGEVEIARITVQLARAADPGTQESEPAYFLLGPGRASLEGAVGYRPPMGEAVRRLFTRGRSASYLVCLAAVTSLALGLALHAAGRLGAPLWEQLALGALALIPASELAISLVNRGIARLLPPVPLPKLQLEGGVPSELRTIVVVPTLLTSEAEVDELVERLEIHFLGNDDGELRFALLTDWTDALEEHRPSDEALLARARAGIGALNARYSPAAGARFFLCHRARRWNPSEGRWMGWERKRGKLHEFNRLLRGDPATSFMDPPGELPGLSIRYVITLDSDTRLPRGAAAKLVATIAHPLNRAVHGPSGRVISGYGILQPRVTPTLPELGEGTHAQRIFSGTAGIDPYAFAASDVYQDLFAEGSYTGKGIYDVDAFERALEGRIPENTLLSHDLFEGVHARAGLVSDVELFESCPAHYQVVAARQHRWARGDWQLLPWLIGTASLPLLGRWKMLDNLRRTLVAPTRLGTLLAAWLLPDGRPWVWTAFVAATFGVPVLLPIVADLLPRRKGLSLRSHFRDLGQDVALAVLRAGLGLAMLPEEAWQMVDAVGRTIHRLTLSRRRLLEWVTADQVRRGARLELQAFQREMAVSVGLSAAALVAVVQIAPHALRFAAPVAILWTLAPVIARWISSPRRLRPGAALDAVRANELRLIARRTWAFFQTFVTAAEHHLPPDNVQEDPARVVAHRTSPTNIGLYLLSATSAHDMGWISAEAWVERLEATFDSIDKLERHGGHLYNWYETTSLAPLAPRYISTVDSGNLAGHLIAVQQACLEPNTASAADRALDGVRDDLAMLRDALVLAGDDQRHGPVPRGHLDEIVELIDASLVAPVDWTALRRTAERLVDTAEALADERGGDGYLQVRDWSRVLLDTVTMHARPASPNLPARLRALAERAERLALGMDWTLLYEPETRLFSIGYNKETGRLDASSYDLLASECRLASFLAIATGQLPARHWFRLGRRLTPVAGGSALVSWSGSMFEYLMPGLVMAAPQGSLLAQTDIRIVHRQIRYGRERGVPWGISEAAYNVRDLELTYQYSNFGVSGLGLKRGLADELVIAPYATALAAMIDPVAAADNFVALDRAGALGRYGFFESVDYTAARLPDGTESAVVKAWFAHHQGMSVVALCNTLSGFAMRRRFHASPIVQATELLLHERTPRHVAVARTHADEAGMHLHVRELVPPVLRRFSSPHSALPATHWLSNGRYSLTFTSAGGGQSVWRNLAVTRWREDETLDAAGAFVYVRDVHDGRCWSAGHQPTGIEADSYEASFHEHHVEICRRDGSIETHLDVVLASEVDAELRQVTLTNHGSRVRTLELTSYAEVVLAPDAADMAHPAFSNLFVETEFDPAVGALLATRRPRSGTEERVWAAHVSAVHNNAGARLHGVQFETDRARFIGRGRSVRTAAAVFEGHPLSNTVGAVLDPIFSLRHKVVIGPGEVVRVTFTTLVGVNKQRLLALADAYRDPGAFERTSGQAWTYCQSQLRHLGIDPDEAQLFQRLASRVLYAGPAMRTSRAVMEANQLGQSSLWRFGISGDRPILLGRIESMADRDLVRQLAHAQAYWRLKGLSTDLVVLNDEAHSYGHDLQSELEALARASQASGLPNGVHVVRGELLSPEDRGLLLTASRVVIDCRDGSLPDQVLRQMRSGPTTPAARAASPQGAQVPLAGARPGGGPPTGAVGTGPSMPDLNFYNGIGGFSKDGRDYVITLSARQWTPLPWVNVIANPTFGFVVSESGGGFTWSENSRENQLTPWSNDPVSDPPGEVLYLRDDETGETWTATPLPVREDAPYVIRHGQGYTRFLHESHGLALDLVQFVAASDSVKVSHLRIHNTSGRPRRISVAAYAEWVLGASRAAATPFVVTSLDPTTGAILARNVWKDDFAARVAFLDLGGRPAVASGDRADWIGRNGALATPAGLSLQRAAGGRLGAGLDPCAMLLTKLVLPRDAKEAVVALLGEAESEAHAQALITRIRARGPDALLDEVVTSWDTILETVQVKTPDPAMDLLLNRWLLYQTLSCRIWARAGFYQAGGAYGFRDQLQDGMALTITRPDLARAHILRAAARQFPEGDVQHWWHPPSGKGVRTRFSDDRAWLAFAVAQYLEVTEDSTILDAPVGYVEGPPLAPGQEDAYLSPDLSSRVDALYEHAARALDISLQTGRHGLPLIGAGDWNDGMNRVGIHGQGESVWLAWFLITTLERWAPIAAERGDGPREAAWRQHAAALRVAVEAEGWDGDWYRRAFMDDGTPLGSASGVECRIDSIAQSWAVISGAAPHDRGVRAMSSMDEHLVRRADGVVLLLTPPFDRTPLDPGYIKGYLPGVRENGGQYTHAALWAMIAFAELGEGDRAGELFTMLNPVHRTSSRAGVQRYKGEPYVAAGDVYSVGAHVGRAGWTWYTGSASWMYRAGLEYLLGFRLRGAHLHFQPCIPASWPGFEITFKWRKAVYSIAVVNPQAVQRGVVSLTLDGQDLDPAEARIPLVEDGAHTVRVTLGDGQRTRGLL